MKRLAILGAGDLGLQMANLAASTGRYLLAGFFDDTRNPGDVVAGARILGRLDDVRSGFASGAFDCLVVAVGYNHMALRRALHAEHAGSIPFATLVHRWRRRSVRRWRESGMMCRRGCSKRAPGRSGRSLELSKR